MIKPIVYDAPRVTHYCANCAAARKEVYELKSELIKMAGRFEYIATHSDWTPAELIQWARDIDRLLDIP